MMLPSGNDAAQSLALYFGVLIQFDRNRDPNTYLTVVDAKEIDDQLAKNKLQPPHEVIPENETPEQKRLRFIEKYDIS